MSRFIATVIERAANVSLEKGQEKYRAYFIKTSLYTPYKADADALLTAEGYVDVIVSE